MAAMKGRTVILAAGDYPRKGSEGARLLASAERVIACDSAAETFLRHANRAPDFIVGDLDSLSPRLRNGANVIYDDDDETNDLTKAISFCRASRWKDLVIVGATGAREDHTIGNIFRALEAGVRVVTDAGAFIPVLGKVTVKTWVGTGVSVFVLDPATKMTSRGLSWPLNGVSFTTPYRATLNRASAERIVVTSDRRAFLFVERNRAAVRAVVSLGSNIEPRSTFLRKATARLAALPKTRLVDASEVIETRGVGVPRAFRDQDFLNQILLFETTLDALSFSRAMHAIEEDLGRVRTIRNGPRTIDIDLIDFGGQHVATKELVLPHPRAAARAFVMEPMKSLGLALNA